MPILQLGQADITHVRLMPVGQCLDLRFDHRCLKALVQVKDGVPREHVENAKVPRRVALPDHLVCFAPAHFAGFFQAEDGRSQVQGLGFRGDFDDRLEAVVEYAIVLQHEERHSRPGQPQYLEVAQGDTHPAGLDG